MKFNRPQTEELGRKFVQSLPKNVATQTITNGDNWSQLESGDIHLNISGEQNKDFYGIINRLEKDFAPLWDTSSLVDVTGRMVIEAIDPTRISTLDFKKRLNKALQDWSKTLFEAPALWTFYFGICNISHQGLPIKIGHATVFALDETGKAEILSKFDEVSAISPDTPERKEFLRDFYSSSLSGESLNTAASIQVNANTFEAASLLGMEELRRTVDMLNFYAELIHMQPTVVYLPGESTRASQFVIGFKHKGLMWENLEQTRQTAKIAGIWSAMGLFDPHLQKARDLGFDYVSELLRKKDLNNLESRLLVSLRWAAQAAKNHSMKKDYHGNLSIEREQAFLFYTVCLESLFCKRKEDNEKITENLAVCCAQLLGDKLENKQEIFKHIKKLYGRRSDVAHAGEIGISQEEVSNIRYYACASLVQMFTDSKAILLKSDVEFQAWLSLENDLVFQKWVNEQAKGAH